MPVGCPSVEMPISVTSCGVGGEPSIAERFRMKTNELNSRLQGQDFVGIGAELRQLEREVEEAIGQGAWRNQLQDLQRQIFGMVAFLATEPVCSRAKEQEKWVAAGFDRSLLTTDPEAVHFAVSSKLIYTIAMYAKSAPYLDGEPLAVKAVNGAACFKVEGEWRPYAAFKDQIRYSEDQYKFLGWNFIHPAGFVHRDWSDYDRIYPVATLNRAGVRAAMAHAEKFWGEGQSEIDPGTEKPCVLQVLTTGREWEGLPKAWWSQNLRKHYPKHTSLRLILPDGSLYSFGAKMGLQDEAFLCSPEHHLGTGLSTVPTPDYEESRKSDDRTMIALPLSSERAGRILDFASEANKGISFNFARQNCVRFADVVLRLAGVRMTSQVPLGRLLLGTFPSLKVSDVPYVGKGLAAIASAISNAVSPVIRFIGAAFQEIAPYPIRRVWNIVEGAVDEVGARVTACFLNGMALAFLGAGTSIVPKDHPKVSEVENFQQLLSWKDLWTPDAIQVYYSTQLDQWMRGQRNVLMFSKPEHGFCCLNEEILQCRHT